MPRVCRRHAGPPRWETVPHWEHHYDQLAEEQGGHQVIPLFHPYNRRRHQEGHPPEALPQGMVAETEAAAQAEGRRTRI